MKTTLSFFGIHPITHPMVTPVSPRPSVGGPLPAFAVFMRGAELLTDGSRRPWPTAFWLSIRKLHRCRTGRRGAGAGRWRELSHRCGRPEEGPNVVDFLRSRSIDSLDGIVVTNP